MIMKRTILFLAAFLVIISACEKDKNDDNEKLDEIWFSNLTNPVTASSVKDWDLQDRGVCQVDVPIPTDSSATILLDINNDSENDYMITLSHGYFEPTEYCGHCSAYRYDIKIKGIKTSDSIVCVDQSSIPEYFTDSDTITANKDWTNEAILIMKNRCAMISFDIEGEYIGFKHNNQIGWIKIQSTSDNGLTIENYAINLTDNNSILAGQTE
jgi:hypothetical protein